MWTRDVGGIIRGENNTEVALVDMDWEDGDANARLIAAAPELLEVLEAMDFDALLMAANELPNTALPRAAHIRRIVKLAKRAIAKAELRPTV